MNKTFRRYDQHRQFLVPPSLDDWLPVEHPARFISDIVDRALDLSAIYDSYEVAAGAPPFDPSMMLKLLLYGYSSGVTSSRAIETSCWVDVAFRWLAANETPDYRSVARFRRRHLAAIEELFAQVLTLCSRAGLVKLGRVALDGTKVRASASRHKAMSYDHMGPRTEELRREVEAMLAEAEAIDAAEDEEFGADRRGDELPPELHTKEGRINKILEAKAALEAEARDKAAAEARAKAEGGDKSAEEIEQMTEQLERAGLDGQPRLLLADAGYCSKDNLEAVKDYAVDVLVATGRTKHNERVPAAPRGRIPADATDRERTARRLRTKRGRADYARRKAIVEPVFGQMKTRQHAGALRLRSLELVRGEWLLHALCHNLRKLANANMAA
jgi:transposase